MYHFTFFAIANLYHFNHFTFKDKCGNLLLLYPCTVSTYSYLSASNRLFYWRYTVNWKYWLIKVGFANRRINRIKNNWLYPWKQKLLKGEHSEYVINAKIHIADIDGWQINISIACQSNWPLSTETETIERWTGKKVIHDKYTADIDVLDRWTYQPHVEVIDFICRNSNYWKINAMNMS